MLRWIIGGSLKQRALVIAVAAVVTIIGIAQVGDRKVDVLPEFTSPYVEIQTEALGLSAAEVEELVTVPLEAKLLSGVAWVDEIRSESVPGLSSIVLIFEPGTDLMQARQMVQERLTRAGALPKVSKPPTMLQPVSSTNRVMKIGLSSEEISHIDMSVLARWTIRPTLMGIPGVANVAIWGQRKRQIQVHVDPEELREKDISLHQVIKTTGNALWVSPLSFLQASTPGSGGWIDTPNQRLGVRHVLPIVEPEELARVTVEGETLSLGDVADVVENHQPLIGDAIVNDGPGLLLVVEKFPWANTLEVSEKVESVLANLQPGLSGIEIDPTIFRPATYIETSMDNLSRAFLLGGIILFALIVVMHLQWRMAFLNLIVIPLPILAALIVFHLRDASMNMMALTGFVIALGVIIDDVVTDVGHFVHSLQTNRREGNNTFSTGVILKAMSETRGGLVYATLIIVLATAPIFFIKGGLSAAFLEPLVLAYLTAIAASILVAVTVTPALSAVLFSGSAGGHRDAPMARWIQRVYETRFAGTVLRPVLSIVLVVALTICGAALWTRSDQRLSPELKENDLQIKLAGAPGTSHPEMYRILTKISREMRKMPGVRNVGGLAGRAVMSDKTEGINTGELWVNIDPTADYNATVAAVREAIHGYPGLTAKVRTYSDDRVEDILLGDTDDITVRIYGHEFEVLRKKADELRQAFETIEGIADLDIKHQIEEPVVEIEVDLAAAQYHKIKPGDVRRASAVLLSGIEVGNLFEEQKVFDVVVWGKPRIRSDLNRIRDLVIDKPDGGHVRLSDVADVRIVPSQTVIKREGISRHLDIGAKVRGRGIGPVARDMQRVIQSEKFPLEYHAELIGRRAQRNASPDITLAVTVFMVIGILLFLQAAFGSWRAALIVLFTLPMALSGGIIAAFVTGNSITIGSIAGLLLVFGISVRGSITMVRRYKRMEQAEGQTFGPDLIVRGTRELTASIVTVAVTTAGAFLPFLFFGDKPGLEILHPMSIVVIGGLATSILVNIMVIPAFILQFGIGNETDFDLGQMDRPIPSATTS